MQINHNKKRNTAMLREFFSKHMANCIIHKDKNSIYKAQQIWNKHVVVGSEIEKELKLVSLMLETKFDNKQIAYSFLQQIKKAAQALSESKLDKEKTALLREVNNNIKDNKFFNRTIPNYINLASIHLLINSWTKYDSDISSESVMLEDKVLNFLCEKKTDNKNNVDSMLLEDVSEKQVDQLVINIMNEKFNEKFSKQLTEDQKYMLRQFVFENDQNLLKNKMQQLNEETLALITKELDNKKLMLSDRTKLNEVKSLLETEYKNVVEVNDNNFIFYMSISKLNEDLKESI